MRPPVTGTRAGTTSASDAEAQYAEALAVAQQGDPVRARALLERLYLRCRTHVGVRNALGVLRLEAGDAGGAIALLKPLASELPRAAPVWLNLGNAMVAAGRAADAVAPLTRATKLQPADDLAWYG